MKLQRRLVIGALPNELTFTEAATMVGVTYDTVYKWVHAGTRTGRRLPAYRRDGDGRWVVALADLQRWVGLSLEDDDGTLGGKFHKPT